MRVRSVSVRDFRGYETATAQLGSQVTVLTGANGAGKTNLLEALYFGCTGRSCRTTNEREVIRFGQRTTRAVVAVEGEDGPHELAVGFTPGEPKRLRVDGATVERLSDSPHRPLISVFLPDRLELVKGPPALRRAHLDQFVAAMWPARSATRRAYAQSLAQRNALISRIRAGGSTREAVPGWDLQLARHAIALMADRSQAVAAIEKAFTRCAEDLGLEGDSAVAYRPRSRAADAETLANELRERLESDLERGFTGHGPHRDDVALLREGRELRAYGSQGQQRLGLLALLLAEREAIADQRGVPPLLLLDDVMSELDRSRREALVELLRDGAGQSLITATDLEQIPGGDGAEVVRLAVDEGQLFPDRAEMSSQGVS